MDSSYLSSGVINPWGLSKYLLKKQFLKLFGGTFRIYDEAERLVLYADMKAFRLKEDIRIYTEESKTNEVLRISARNIIDLWAAYDIYDSKTSQKIGAFRRQGLKSTFIRDEWNIMDAMDNPIGKIEEDSILMSLLRRFLTNLIPQNFHGFVNGQQVLTFSQNFNPFVLRLTLDFTSDINGLLDRRMGIAAAVLLSAIEGRQESS